MKYTRYDLKSNKNKKNNELKSMPILILLVLVLAIVIGTLIFKLIYPKLAVKDDSTKIPGKHVESNNGDGNNGNNIDASTAPIKPESENEEQGSNIASDKDEFLTVQLGYYSSKEGAEEAKAKVDNKASVIKDGDKFRVIGYIGREANVNKYLETIKTVDSSKTRYTILKTEGCDKKIAEMANGFIEILDKVKDDTVKSVKTNEYKEWAKALEDCKDCKNYDALNTFKGEIEKLPESISKNNTESCYQLLFDLLNKAK
ncbi:MAG: hypothetical protein ACRDD2_03695 [Sarcina sp.]